MSDNPARTLSVIAESASEPAAVLAAGECLVERFVIARELGQGAGGAVFLARDRKLARDVAIKVLPRGVSDQRALARFELEARAAGALEHPNVLAVHDVGMHEGSPFIVSELLEGLTLRQRLGQGALPGAEAVSLAFQLAQGLAATHEKGIVHRDLKPENLFVLREGRLKILDFGVAKLLQAEADPAAPRPRTETGGLIGTVPYMSPEQARGSPADARSDVFAFGAILYEMLSGKPAFARDSEIETGYAILKDEPPELSGDCPDALRALVRRCLAKDPAGRVQSARELVEILEPLARSSAPLPARRWPTRAWALAVSALMGAAVILVTGAPEFVRRWLPQGPGEARRLAVLPFHAVGATPDGEALTAGLNEILTSKLQQVERLQAALRVFSASDVLKEGVTTAGEARTAFGATLALTGTVDWTGPLVTVSVNLIDTRTRLIISAGDVDASREQVSTLSPLLLRKVSDMLALEIQPAASRPLQEATPAPPAYALYLQGRGYLQRYDRLENVDRAVEVFDEALKRDPGFALAHAGAAEAWLRRYRSSRDLTALENARASSRRGIELQPDLAQVHFTAGLVESTAGDYGAAVGRFQQALRVEPANADALRELGNAHDKAGSVAEAESTFRQAVQLRPDSWAACKDLGVFYNRHGRMEEALPWFQRVVALTPDSYASYSNLGGIYLRLGRHAEAASALQRSLSLRPTAVAHVNLGNIRYFEGRFREASESYRKATELAPADERAWGALADALRWLPGTADEMAGAYAQAIALAERRVAAQRNDSELRSRLAMYRAFAGDGQGADADLREAIRLDPLDGTVVFRSALIHEQLGRREQALGAIEQALRTGYSREEIGHAPALEALRRDSRYARIMSDAVALPK
jgi:tetratricopeptide (TPR) repeat protein